MAAAPKPLRTVSSQQAKGGRVGSPVRNQGRANMTSLPYVPAGSAKNAKQQRGKA